MTKYSAICLFLLSFYLNPKTAYTQEWVHTYTYFGGEKKIAVDQQLQTAFELEAASYDPWLSTIAAGLESREYSINKDSFQKLSLAFDQKKAAHLKHPFDKAYYPKTPPIYYRENLNSERLYIIFSSSYSSWKNGTWIKKVIHLLDKIHSKKANIIVTPGYQVPGETLKEGAPPLTDPTGIFVAYDLYNRISQFLSKKSHIKQSGVLGLSGGANIAMALLNAESDYKGESINLGALLFSPVVQTSHTCKVVDSHAKAAIDGGLDPKDYATSPSQIAGSVSLDAIRILSPLPSFFIKKRDNKDYQSYLDAETQDPKFAESIHSLFANEFVAYDLKKIIESTQATDYSWDPKAHNNKRANIENDQFVSGWGYQHFYGDYLFNRLKKEKWVASNSDFDDLALNQFREDVNKPVLVVFSKDDITQNMDHLDYTKFKKTGQILQDDNITELLAELNEHPSINIFNPHFGGHMAYFLDTDWLENTLKVFFNVK